MKEENIKPIDNALDKVCKLKGVTFDWKESDSILEIKEDIGFIAQDVQEVLPELIKEKGADAFEFNEDAYYGRVKGLWTHTNTRKDKFDMFPQEELLDMLMSL